MNEVYNHNNERRIQTHSFSYTRDWTAIEETHDNDDHDDDYDERVSMIEHTYHHLPPTPWQTYAPAPPPLPYSHINPLSPPHIDITCLLLFTD